MAALPPSPEAAPASLEPGLEGHQVIPLPRSLPPALGVGAFLKNSLCRIEGDRAILTRSLGHLDDPAVIAAFENAAAILCGLGGQPPRLVAHDLHPDFHSTRWAERSGFATLPVQHHHAHIAAIACEHGLEEAILGLAFDGFGLGPGNEAWGGELLLVSGPAYRRLGHLHRLVQPGGDIAARQPWRMGAAALAAIGRGDEIAERYRAFPAARLLEQVIAKRLNAPLTSSAGRLFDAACGLLGVHLVAEHEGQAPIALEAMAKAPYVLADGWRLAGDALDLRPMLAALVDRDPEDGANLFHGTLIAALADWVAAAAAQTGVTRVALGGGCFFNKVLRDGLSARLSGIGIQTLSPIKAGPGDPAVSLGQAWIAALAAERL